MQSDTLPNPTEQELTTPCTPTLSAEELETEVGESEEWDEASQELASLAVVGPAIRWVESILGAW